MGEVLFDLIRAQRAEVNRRICRLRDGFGRGLARVGVARRDAGLIQAPAGHPIADRDTAKPQARRRTKQEQTGPTDAALGRHAEPQRSSARARADSPASRARPGLPRPREASQHRIRRLVIRILRDKLTAEGFGEDSFVQLKKLVAQPVYDGGGYALQRLVGPLKQAEVLGLRCEWNREASDVLNI